MFFVFFCAFRPPYASGAAKVGGDAGYTVEPADEPTYFPGRQAYIVREGKKIGVFGIVHPDVAGSVVLSLKLPGLGFRI